MLTNIKLTDIETFYKMAKRVVIQSINIKENRFGIEPEITAKSLVAIIGSMRSGFHTSGAPTPKEKRLAGEMELELFTP